MLTKSIAKYSEFAIHEEDRERYSYLDYSIVNRFTNPGFEEGSESDPYNWMKYGDNTSRVQDYNHSGYYGIQIQANGGWIEQDITDVPVHSIYEENGEYEIWFWGKSSGFSMTDLNVTIYYTDMSTSSHQVNINSYYYRKYSIVSLEILPNKIIDKIRFLNSDPDEVYLDDFFIGEIYSDKPPGLSLLAVPIYWVGDFIAVNVLGIDSINWQLVDDVIKFLTILCVLALGAYTVVKFYDLLRLLGISHQSANWAALVFAFGSLFYVYIGTFFSHGITASFILLATYYATKFRYSKEITSLLLASVFFSYSVVCDFVLIFFLPFSFCYVFIPFPWNYRDLVTNWKQYLKVYLPMVGLYIIPIIICGLLITFYNFSCFDDPTASPYKYSRFFSEQHFANSMMEGLEVLVFSTQHGLIVFMPIVLVCVIGFIPMYKKFPALASFCTALPLVLILLYSKYFRPDGGLAYGPRYIITIIPLLLLPLGFLLDFKSHGNLIRGIVNSVLQVFSILLGILSFLINFAGGWVGVYPLGGESMADPIWGTADQVGHLPTLFSWFQISIEGTGQLSLEILQGNYTGGFKLNAIMTSFQLYLQWPSASSLARGEPAAFFAALFLAVLINPYFSPLEWGSKLSRRIKTFYLAEKPMRILVFCLILEGILLVGFVIWIVSTLFPIIGNQVRDLTRSIWEILAYGYETLESIPILNLIIGIPGFILYSLVMFIPLRSDPFSLPNWFINVVVFICVISIAWLPFNQLEKENGDQKNVEKDYLIESSIFRIYRYLSIILAIIYLITSLHFTLFPLLLETENTIYYTNFALILYFSIFLITAAKAMTPFYTTSAHIQSPVSPIKNNLEIENKSKYNMFKASTFGIVSLFLLLIILLNISSKMAETQFSFSDFLFITPSFQSESLKDWFRPINQPVLVYMGLGLILVAIVFAIPIYQLGVELGKFPRTFPKFSSPLERKLTTQYQRLSFIQGILIIGGLVQLFVFLLISMLYSVLSSVPDLSTLKTHGIEWIIWYSIFHTYIFGLILGVFFYPKANLHTPNHVIS